MTSTPSRGVPSDPPESVITDAMLQFGGSFVQQLGRLYRVADEANREKLRTAFADYWDEYRQLATLKAGRLVENGKARRAL